MALNPDWRIIIRFACVGAFLALAFGGLELWSDRYPLPGFYPHSSMLAVLLIVLCPGGLILVALLPAFDIAEVGTPGFYVFCFVMTLVNAALYSVIGAAFVGLRRNRSTAVR